MTLRELNRADDGVAREALFGCCGSKRWVEEMAARRPFESESALFAAAEAVWWGLEPVDWLEAFAAHPRIGEKKLSGWASLEQNGLHSAPGEVTAQLAGGNQEYENRFGWIFLVQAAGKTAAQMLEALSGRLKNTPEEELRLAAGEQAKITELRLKKLLNK